MEIYEKAKELAKAISNSSELKVYRDAEAEMMCDPLARKLIEEYQNLQMVAMQKNDSGEMPEDLQKKLEELEEKMSQNKNIKAYMEAQENLEQVLRSVNLIISEALNQSNNNCSASGCSGCTSCC